MISQFLTKCIIFMLVMVISGSAFACGESLFRVGKGVSYREYTAPIPGNIIVVASTPQEMSMVERLAAAGHHVTVVADANELPDSLADTDTDIVLAMFNDRELVEGALNSYQATYLPVAEDNPEQIRQAKDLYARSLVTDDSVKQFLKTIHKTLKQRQT